MSEQRSQLGEINAENRIKAGVQVIDRLEREIQPQSDRFFNVGILIVGIAASAVIAIPTVASPVLQAALGTLALCFVGAAVLCFIAGREINRARRLTRSIVIKNAREI